MRSRRPPRHHNMTHAEVILVRDADGHQVSLGCIGRRVPRCDLGLVDELAQIQLMARRHGWSIRLRRASPELVELLALAGLTEIIASEPVAPPTTGPLPESPPAATPG